MARSGLVLDALTPRSGLELMCRLYAKDSANRRLSCAWGHISRYGEKELGLSITCWFEASSEDSHAILPVDFSLKFKYCPQATSGDFRGWMTWCCNLGELAAFRSSIEGTLAFEDWKGATKPAIVLVNEGISDSHALFDCWGVRDPSRPVVSMTEAQWLGSDDVPLMLRWFRQEWRGEERELNTLLQRFLLACCRRIWRLLPGAKCRAGVEVAERTLEGLATREEFGLAEYLAEGEAFKFENDLEDEDIARWCEDVSRISSEELATMICPSRSEDDISSRVLLEHAAYFAVAAMCYPDISPKESIERFRLFLPAPLLRVAVGNPFRSSSSGSLD